MIEGIEEYHTAFARSVVDSMPAGWVSVTVESFFFGGCTEAEAEYIDAQGRAVGVQIPDDFDDLMFELREKFRSLGKRVWGRSLYRLDASGEFNLK
ncbi:hypothetical protein RMSM_00444 [Rhodopirellula maiorica SM1]|uniref:Uncharacterized protein n=2 Tax=Novipirellula TaxID=2795426 RepID=M5S4Q8_9BACT|nr:hypothetical protein RMSM_00444 [Rhodopirellula maiorica SM1]